MAAICSILYEVRRLGVRSTARDSDLYAYSSKGPHACSVVALPVKAAFVCLTVAANSLSEQLSSKIGCS